MAWLPQKAALRLHRDRRRSRRRRRAGPGRRTLEAIAVTLTGPDHIGVATLGTALTDTQADQLRPHLGAAGDGMLVATDNDPAGRRAAARACDLLTARGADPRHVVLPDGADPADLYRTDPAALQGALASAGSLTGVLTGEVVAEHARHLDTVEGQVFAARGAAQSIAALPADAWAPHVQALVDRLDLAPSTVWLEVADAIQARAKPPAATAGPVPPAPPAGQGRTRSPAVRHGVQPPVPVAPDVREHPRR